MRIEEHVSLKTMSTFAMGGEALFVSYINSLDDLSCSLDQAEQQKIQTHILGGGSNTLFADGLIRKMMLKMEMKGIEIVDEDNKNVWMKVGAGEIWDEVVLKSVNDGFSGIEALSAIPGTIGAAPVQNIGAYGQEIKDTLVSVEVFNKRTHEISMLSNNLCNFAYRDSVFKNKDNPYIITSVILKLSKAYDIVQIPHYSDVTKYSNERKNEKPSLVEIRNAIVEIRSHKLPDWHQYPNCGSFFKNVLVDVAKAHELKMEFPEMPQFLTEDEQSIKIPSGWLIEKAGFKGMIKHNIGVYSKNALVLYNHSEASFNDLLNMKYEIVRTVKNIFGVELDQEPIAVEN